MASTVARGKAVLAATGVTPETVGLTGNGNDSSCERSNGRCIGNNNNLPTLQH